MTDDNKIQYFQSKILAWFEKFSRKFKWRNEFLTTYEIIISEILLQRTKAETVSNFYNHFIKEFPNWDSIAFADLKDVEKYLIPIGLYRQRAIRLKNLALYMQESNEYLPMNRLELDKIPFMGQYIGNAVELLIYNRRKPLLDVNMARLLERYFGSRKLSDIRYDPYLQELSHKVVDHPLSKYISWGILDFAALVCKARKPDCLNCMLKDNCLFYQNALS